MRQQKTESLMVAPSILKLSRFHSDTDCILMRVKLRAELNDLNFYMFMFIYSISILLSTTLIIEMK